MNLFEINEAIQKCMVIDDAVVDSETGEILDADYLNGLEMARDEKIENIAKWIKNLDADIEALKKQKEIFESRKKQAERKRDSLKQYLSAFLNGQKWDAKDKSVAVSFRKSESVNIIDEYQIPVEYLVLPEPKIDKMLLKKDLKSGSVIAGAELVTSNNIQIK